MTIEEYWTINWQRGNVVKLNNGKEYLCKGTKSQGRYLLLYSLEYDANFIADYKIIDSQVSDYAEPEEVYLKHKAEKQAIAEAKREAERKEYLKHKQELKQQHLKEQEEAHQKAVARKEAKKALRQLELEEEKQKKETEKSQPKLVQKQPAQPKAEKPVAETPKQETPKPAVQAPAAEEAPKKRTRQRIKIMKSITEKVNIFKK